MPQVPIVTGVVAPIFVLHLPAGQGLAPSVHVEGLQPTGTSSQLPSSLPTSSDVVTAPRVGPENYLPAPPCPMTPSSTSVSQTTTGVVLGTPALGFKPRCRGQEVFT